MVTDLWVPSASARRPSEQMLNNKNERGSSDVWVGDYPYLQKVEVGGYASFFPPFLLLFSLFLLVYVFDSHTHIHKHSFRALLHKREGKIQSERARLLFLTKMASIRKTCDGKATKRSKASCKQLHQAIDEIIGDET